MITIYPNLKSITARIFVVTLLGIMQYLIIRFGILGNDIQPPRWFLFLFCFLLTLISLALTVSFFGIIKVVGDNSSGELTFFRLFSRKIVQKPEITGYYVAIYNSRYHGTTYGRIIKTNDNKIRELNPGNLKDVSIVDDFLKNQAVEFLGERKSTYPYRGL